MKSSKTQIITGAALIMTAWGCGAAKDGGSGGGRSTVSSYPSIGSKWASPAIEVCWESSANAYPTERQWVENRVTAEYGPKTNVSFYGWQNCYPGGSGVHVSVSDAVGANPHTTQLGRFLNGLDSGMELNFTFQNWSQTCQGDRENCVESIAVHEFGHAIGLAHEQNRPDTPSTCNQPKQGGNGDTLVGSWDAFSVMNYCNPVYNGGGHLSSGDVAGVATLYGSK